MSNFAKAMLLIGLVLLYLACPFDCVPDFIPGLGQLDDLFVVGFGGKKAVELLKTA